MLLHLLAQIPVPTSNDYTPPKGISDWLENLFWFVGLVTALVALIKMLKPKPAMHEYVLSGEFNERMAAMDAAASESREKMHNATRVLERKVAEMDGAMKAHSESMIQQMHYTNLKLDALTNKMGDWMVKIIEVLSNSRTS